MRATFSTMDLRADMFRVGIGFYVGSLGLGLLQVHGPSGIIQKAPGAVYCMVAVWASNGVSHHNFGTYSQPGVDGM